MNTVKERLKDLTRPTSEDEALRVDYPAPRFEVSTKALIMVTVVAVVGIMAFALVVFARTTPGGGPAPAGVSSFAEAQPFVASPSPTNDHGSSEEHDSGALVVSVVGDVEKPGLYTFPPGARVAEALEAAGAQGHEPSARAGVNLAERLVDAQQIYVPREGEILPQAAQGLADGGSESAGGGKINVNTASVSELETLDGVGAKTAQAIIAHRDSVGGFSSIEQLMEVKGIGPAKFDGLKDQVTV